MRSTVGFVLKNSEDMETMAELFAGESCACGGECDHGDHDHGGCAHHHSHA